MRLYHEYCAAVSHAPWLAPGEDALETDPAHPGRLFDFLGWLHHTRPAASVTTLRSYISTVRSRLALDGISLKHSNMYKQTLHRLLQQPHPSRTARQPATAALIRRVCGDHHAPLALRAAVAVAWCSLLRSREYTAESARSYIKGFTLLRRHCKWREDVDGGCYEIHLPHSKSDVYNNGTSIFVLRVKDDPLCPVRLLAQYLNQTKHHPENSPLFILPTGAYVTRLDITAVLKAHAPAVGLPADRITSHSIRIGAAFVMLAQGVPWPIIRTKGRWMSDAVALHYARQSDTTARLAADALTLTRRPGPEAAPMIGSFK
jgi:hypothetical protein